MNPIILADNRFLDGTPTATDTDAGYDVNNIIDLRPYTFWKAASVGTKYLTVGPLSPAKSVDTIGIIGHNLFTATASVSVESSVNGSSWTERLAAFTPASDRAVLKTLTSVSAAYWRVKIVTASVAAYCGVVMLGVRLTFPYPPDAPHVPYSESIEAEATRSRGGNLLGNVVRYKPIEISPSFSTLARSWVTDTYKPFWDDYGSELMPFFYAWDLSVYPADVFFASMTEDAVFAPPVSISAYYDSLKLSMRGVKE